MKKHQPASAPGSAPDDGTTTESEHARYISQILRDGLSSAGELPRESQELLKAVVSHLPVVLWVVDAQGIIQLTEGQGLKLFGLKPGDLVGLRHSEVYRERPDLVECVKRALRGEEFRIEQRMDPFLFDVYFTPIFAPDGNVTHMVGLTYDVTEQKRLERELRAAVETRDAFLGIASHELKTPLTSIKLQLQMRKRILSRAEPENQQILETRVFIDRLERQFDRVARLVDDMLDASRIESGKLSVRPETTDLSEVVRVAVERISPCFEIESRALVAEIQPGLIGSFDGFRLEQVINNLLINALRHAAPGPVHVRLHDTSGGSAEIQVVDQGPGIPAHGLERIFDRFESGKESRAGLGLGLYISKAIVEAHGGEIRAESDVGRGSTFIISLPLARQL